MERGRGVQEQRKRLEEEINPEHARRFAPTRFDPRSYFTTELGWTPWESETGLDSQQSAIDAYVLALRQQIEKTGYENGDIEAADLHYWEPNQVIQNWIRVEAGHTVGKTKFAGGLVSHFFDHFPPALVYTFAPGWDQVKHLLWKEISTDRYGKDLPGRVTETCEIKLKANYFAKGIATNDAHGRGAERVQGQHGPFLLFVIDEAEGVADFVYDAVESMTSGGVSIVLMTANPRTRNSRFYQTREHSYVRNFRISCLNHPNVIAGREIIPGAVRREYVDRMLETNAQKVSHHNPDDFTFEVPWIEGAIFRPDPVFMYRVLGIPPSNVADRNLVPVGRFEAACAREPISQTPSVARVGIDCARFGADVGTIYVRHDGRVWCHARLTQLNTLDYVREVKALVLELVAAGVNSLHIRVDGGGGFGAGVIDLLEVDDLMITSFLDYQIHELHFNASPISPTEYYDGITEWTADVAESLKRLAIIDASNELQADLCEREYKWRNLAAEEVKRLESKDEFRARKKRSPDDGDGFVLATLSDHLIEPDYTQPQVGGERTQLTGFRVL